MALNTAPSLSNLPFFGPDGFGGRLFWAMYIEIMPRGTLIRKSQCHCEDSARECWANRGGRGHCHGIEGHAPAKQGARIDKPDKGRIDGHDAGRAHALYGAAGHQHFKRSCSPAKSGSQGENNNAGNEYPAIGCFFPKRGQGKQEHGYGQLVNCNDPDDVRTGNRKLPREDREGDIHDCAVNHAHEQLQQQRCRGSMVNPRSVLIQDHLDIIRGRAGPGQVLFMNGSAIFCRKARQGRKSGSACRCCPLPWPGFRGTILPQVPRQAGQGASCGIPQGKGRDP